MLKVIEGLKIRNLTAEDAKTVKNLIFQLTQNIFEPENLEERLRFMALHAGEGFDCIVGEINGEVVAFGEVAWYMIPSKGLMVWIEEVVVDHNHRNKGVASILMEELIKLAENSQPSQIKLTTKNPSAKKIYEASGFIDKGESLMAKLYF